MAFTKKLLYTKDTKQPIDNYLNMIPLLEELREEAELINEKPLDDEELETLVTNPVQFGIDFKAKIRKGFKFEKASEEFNLQSMGISFAGLDKVLKDIPANDYKYQIVDDCIESLESEIERIEEAQKVYTTNQKQNNALKVCQDLCKDLARLQELQPVNSMHWIKNISKGLIQAGYDEAGKLIAVINYQRLEQLR